MKEAIDVAFDELCQREKKAAAQYFKFIFLVQWPAVIIYSLVKFPYSWDGVLSHIHPHLEGAAILGGCLTVLPLYFIHKDPSGERTMDVITVCQAIFSILIIHLSGGRIESHFHVFGSLAFLSGFRHHRPVIVYTVITVLDHFIRGQFMPGFVYGISGANPWRAVEHGAWVLFEVAFLLKSISQGLERNFQLASHEVQLQDALSNKDRVISVRSTQLEASHKTIDEQNLQIITSAKLAAIGEMAAGMAHEINNPLAIISSSTALLKKRVELGKTEPVQLLEITDVIDKTVVRIFRIINSLRVVVRKNEGIRTESSIGEVIDDVLALCQEKIRSADITVSIDDPEGIATQKCLLCRVELAQVLLNLLTNAHDALKPQAVREIKITLGRSGEDVTLRVSDTGRP